MNAKKRVLLIAFHFPPYGSGSGVHRAATIAQYLPEHGWQPYILTARTRAYEHVSASAPDNMPGVIRTFALDAQRHLGFRGRYFRWSAIPDRWSSWAIAAVPKGLFALYTKNIQFILVTFPIATAVLIGLTLHLLTGKPLVMDFRDSMTEEEYPRDLRTRRVCRALESLTVRRSSLVIFTTESTRTMYLKRYADLSPDKCVVIPNGYDEDDFKDLVLNERQDAYQPVRLVHAGVIYTDDRDPTCFFRTLARLKAEGIVGAHNLRIDLRASGSEHYYSLLLRHLHIESLVQLQPPLPHRAALNDIINADGLLLFQAASCNHQIPAKVYEYFRTGRPILALTDPSGDTAKLLQEVGGATVVDLQDENAIYVCIPKFLRSIELRTHDLPDPAKVQSYTRRRATAELARHLDKLCRSDIRAKRLAGDRASV